MGKRVNSMELEGRVASLERKNRRLTALLFLVTAVAFLAVLLGAKAGPRVLEAERFVLKDLSGKQRIAAGNLTEGLGCQIYDAKGKPSFLILITDQGTMNFKSLIEETPAQGGGKPAGPAKSR